MIDPLELPEFEQAMLAEFLSQWHATGNVWAKDLADLQRGNATNLQLRAFVFGMFLQGAITAVRWAQTPTDEPSAGSTT